MMWFMLQVHEHILWYLATEEPSKPDTIGTVLNGEVSSFQGLLSTFLELRLCDQVSCIGGILNSWVSLYRGSTV